MQPQFEKHISMMDKDLRTALFFMISVATVLEEMTQDLIGSNDIHVDYEKYERKISRHQSTYENVFQNFIDEMFGEFENKATRDEFKASLSKEGWKYFNLYSLNGLFCNEFNKLSEDERAGVVMKIVGGGIADRFSK